MKKKKGFDQMVEAVHVNPADYTKGGSDGRRYHDRRVICKSQRSLILDRSIQVELGGDETHKAGSI